MSTLFLQLENALAEARELVLAANEKVHETGLAHAQARADMDAAAENVRRLEGAANSLNGVAPAAPNSVATAPKAESQVVISGDAYTPPKPRRPRPSQTGPQCTGCGERGKLTQAGPIITCGACSAQFVGSIPPSVTNHVPDQPS
jgi:hypothetical protein